MGKNIEDLIWKIVQTKLDNNPEYQKLKEDAEKAENAKNEAEAKVKEAEEEAASASS